MSLITCPECNNKVSDKSDNCIHCGYPIKTNTSPTLVTTGNSTEKAIEIGIDIIFAIFYIAIIYVMFLSGNSDQLISQPGAWIAFFFTVAIIYVIQKLSKAMLGTIARAFDSFFKK